MNRRLILSAFLVLCLSTGLLAQGKLGVYAAAFYNLENLWDTEDNPDNPVMMTLLRAVSTNGHRSNTNRNCRMLPR